jgi:hypothetical protein
MATKRAKCDARKKRKKRCSCKTSGVRQHVTVKIDQSKRGGSGKGGMPLIIPSGGGGPSVITMPVPSQPNYHDWANPSLPPLYGHHMSRMPSSTSTDDSMREAPSVHVNVPRVNVVYDDFDVHVPRARVVDSPVDISVPRFNAVDTPYNVPNPVATSVDIPVQVPRFVRKETDVAVQTPNWIRNSRGRASRCPELDSESDRHPDSCTLLAAESRDEGGSAVGPRDRRRSHGRARTRRRTTPKSR